MGIQLVANDVVAPWNSKVLPPVSRGLEGWFNFDTDSSRFARNRAIGKGDGLIVGSPVAYPTHGRFKGGTNFLTTQIGETAEMTIIVIGRAVSEIPAGAAAGGDANTPFYAGSRGSALDAVTYPGTAYGVALYSVAAGSLRGSAGRVAASGTGGTPGTATLSGETTTTWAMRAIRVSGSLTTVLNLTRSAQAVSTDVGARVMSGAKMQIGGAGAFAAEVDISAVVFASVAWTDAEIALNAALLRKRMARLGITI
jgi:hypothetical protein